MIKDIFRSATIVGHQEAGPLGSHLDLLATALQKQGYATTTIGVHLREAHGFGRWLNERHQIDEISEFMLERYLSDLSPQEEPLTLQRRQRITAAIRLLLKHLRQTGVIATPPIENLPQTEAQMWLLRYQEYLDKVIGLAPKTVQRLSFFAARLLEAMSRQDLIEWEAFTADKITAFLQAESAHRKGAGPHAPATALRSFLRFLVSQGRLSAGLELAIPPIRRWSQSALPQRLSETEINHLLTSCADHSPAGRRNYVILLVLSRRSAR